MSYRQHNVGAATARKSVGGTQTDVTGLKSLAANTRSLETLYKDGCSGGNSFDKVVQIKDHRVLRNIELAAADEQKPNHDEQEKGNSHDPAALLEKYASEEQERCQNEEEREGNREIAAFIDYVLSCEHQHRQDTRSSDEQNVQERLFKMAETLYADSKTHSLEGLGSNNSGYRALDLAYERDMARLNTLKERLENL